MRGFIVLNRMKIANKKKKAFNVGKEVIVVDIITPPLYYCQNEILTEYDVRNIQRSVAIGDITHHQANRLRITDERGMVFDFREDGVLTNSPYGYDITTGIVLDILKMKRLNGGKDAKPNGITRC